MKKILASFLVIIFLLISGCIRMDHKIKQDFNEDGSSLLVINLETGINEELLNKDLGSESYTWKTIIELLSDYTSSKEYAETLCNSADKSKVKSCKANGDGSVEITAELKPGKFYKYEEEFDWLNLRKIMHYKIKKIPLITYYEDDLYTHINNDIQEFFSSHLSDYIKQDYFCEADDYTGLIPECKAYRENGNNIFEINVTTSKELKAQLEKFSGYYCGDRYSLYQQDLDIVPLNVSAGKTLRLSCPEEKTTLILVYTLGYEDESYDYKTAFNIKTKDQIKDEVIQTFLASRNYISTPKLEDKELPYHYWDFENASFMGNDYNSIQKSAYGEAPMFKAEYTPKFDGKIISARIGSKELKTNENSFTLRLSEMGNYPDSAIEVVVVKEVSPLGVYTWILGVIILGAIVFAYKSIIKNG